MKLLIILCVLLTTGCGVSDKVRGNCNDLICEFFLGSDKENDEQNERLELIEGDLDELEASYDSIINELNFLSEQNQLTQTQINNTQIILENIISDITQIKTGTTIDFVIDPCGDHPNHYDEVVLKLSSGEYLAYFEASGRRFLTVLEQNVIYETTDKQKCRFYINSNNNLVD